MAEKSSTFRTIVEVFTVVGVVVGVVTLWNEVPGFQRPFCQELPTRGALLSWGWCGSEHRPVSAEEAAATVDEYLRKAGGPIPGDAWELLGAEEKADRSREEFLTEWTPVARAERLSDPVAAGDGRNWFSVTYRVYRVTETESDGEPDWQAPRAAVDERVVAVRLEHTDDGRVVLDDFGDTHRPTGDTVDLAWADFIVDTVTKRLPSRDAETAAPKVSEGNGVRVLCALEVDGETWYSSYLGWFPESEVRLTDVPDPGVPQCSPHLPASTTAVG